MSFIPIVKLIPKENIKKGNAVVILWKHKCRNAKADDYKTLYIAIKNCRKDKPAHFMILTNEEFLTSEGSKKI